VGAVSKHIGSPRFLALVGTVVLWASAFPAIRVGVDGLGVAALSLLRLAVASVALTVVALFSGVRLPRLRDVPHIFLCGATGMTAYQVMLNWGEVHVPAGTASLLIAAVPVFSVLLAGAFLAEPVTRRVVAGSVISVAGCALVALGGVTSFSVSAFVVLGAAVMQGTYHVASKPLLRRYTGLEVATYAMWAGTVLALPLIPVTVRSLGHATSGALASVVYLGLLPSAVGFVIWGYAVARLPMAVSTAGLYLVPPVTLVIAYVWLSEVPRPVELVGGLITILGVVLINRRSPRGNRTAATTAAKGPAPVHAAGHQDPAAQACDSSDDRANS
jgi:drug/metabolite transporter (DMT)-like permease